MSIENLVYNCSGEYYWELLYREEYNGRTCLYEGRHGRYVGEVIEGQVFNSNTGEYLGEFYNDRLIVDESKVGEVKINGNFMFHPMGRMGHACIPPQRSIAIPQGYTEFTVGFE